MRPEDQTRLAEAVAKALEWHGPQTRKGTAVPYVAHLLQVAGLVLEYGGSVDQAVAALLHDAVEDTDATPADIALAFGPAVAAIVDDATDTLPGDTPERKSPWTERKQAHLDHLATLGPDSALVVACDKLHNLRAFVADARADGVESIGPPRFSVRPDRQLWYLTEATDRVRPAIPARLAAALDDGLTELAEAIRG